MARGKAPPLIHYALAPIYIALATLLHVSPAGAFLHPTGLFVLAVIAAAWFGGVGPGFFATLLATLVLPQLIEISYPLTAGWLDLPRFVTFAVTGLAVGWGATRSRRAAALQRSEERYAMAMNASDEGFWDWDVATDDFHASPRLLEMCGFPHDTVFASRADFLSRYPFAPGERARWQEGVTAHFAGKSARFDMEIGILCGEATRWIHATGMATRDASGALVRWTGAMRDVTARRSMEQALRLSEERHALAMQAAQDAHWDWNVATDEYYTSPRVVDVFGLPPGTTFTSRQDYLAKTPLLKEDLQAWLGAARELFAGTGSRLSMELRAMIRGEIRWIQHNGVCLRDASGRAVRWCGTVRDVTERRRTEDALRLSEERYERALKASEDGIWEWNPASDRMFLSARARELFGVPDGVEIDTRARLRAEVRFHPEDRQRTEHSIQASLARRAGGFDIEYRVIDAAGEMRWLRSRAKVFPDAEGAPALVTGALTDVTKRKRAEEALRESEKRYERVMFAAEAGFWDWYLPTDAFYVSPKLLEMGGFAPGTAFVDRATFMERAPFHPEDRVKWQRAVSELFAGGGSRLTMELRVLIGGEMRWHNLNGICFRDAEGKVVRWTGSSTDITERKRAEEALRASEERYALAMQASGEGHWDWKIASDEFYASPRYLEIGGFPPGTKLSSRAALVDRIPFHPEDGPKYEAAMAAHFAGETPRMDIVIRIVPHGEMRWLHVIGTCSRDAAGVPVRWAGSVNDVTARKTAEEALRLSEERYAHAMEGSDAGHWDWNLVTGEMFVSQRAREMLALPDGPLPAQRDAIMALVPQHSDDRAVMSQQTELGIESGSHERDYRVIPRPGEVRWLRSRGKVFKDAQGVPVRLTGSLLDITERKLAVDALRLSEERYALAMDASQEGHYDWNVQTDEIFASAKTNELVGLPADVKHANRTTFIRDIPYHPEDRAGLFAELVAVLAGSALRHEFEYRILVKGEVRWLAALWLIHRDEQGAALRVVCVLNDITERKRAADELRARQEMLELAQKSARAIAFEWRIGSSGEGENRWSADLEAVYGLAPGTYDGSYESWKKLLHRDDWPAVKEALEHAQRTGEVAAEYRVVHPDGSVHWLQARGRMFFDGAGKPARMVGFMQDVSERKHAEEELRKLEHELRRAQRLEAMGTLAGGIAHDFNNILGAILGYGEMALRGARKGTRLRRDLDSIMSAGERGRSLIDRILAFSRSGVGERVAVHVEAVVREALDLLGGGLPDGLRLRADLRAGSAAMLGDPTQVHQVVMNLGTNGLQAMPEGGMLRVTLEVLRFESPRAASIGAVSPGEYIVLKVADSGTGIAPEVLERMFDPFFSTKEVGVGSGLGLSLVHGIVANVGGAIDVATELGKGTTFTVYLPRSGDAVAKPVDKGRPLPRGAGQRVLVVDDEEPLVQLATRTLEELGYAAVGFTSSSAALAAFRADPQRFDAVITDERMPGISGSSLIREVRGIRDSIPVVLMSGYLGAPPNVREGGPLDALGVVPRVPFGVGADEVLKKPLSARELATSLARVLQH